MKLEKMKKEKNDRMEAVICHACDLFYEHGIDAVKMTDIADASEIGVASLYRYWGTKNALVIQAGKYQWNRVRALFDPVFAGEDFSRKTGAEQIGILLSIQITLFREHKDFLKFLYEFDSYMIRENVPKQNLLEYEQGILNIYPFFEKAYSKSIKDGSVRMGFDFILLYKALSHALMNLSERFVVGEILPSDDFGEAEKELYCLISMAMSYIKSER